MRWCPANMKKARPWPGFLPSGLFGGHWAIMLATDSVLLAGPSLQQLEVFALLSCKTPGFIASSWPIVWRKLETQLFQS